MTSYFESVPELSEDLNVLARATVFENTEFHFIEPGAYGIMHNLATFSKQRFAHLGDIYPPREEPFQRLESFALQNLLGQGGGIEVPKHIGEHFQALAFEL